jgi:hypothetical protein
LPGIQSRVCERAEDREGEEEALAYSLARLFGTGSLAEMVNARVFLLAQAIFDRADTFRLRADALAAVETTVLHDVHLDHDVLQLVVRQPLVLFDLHQAFIVDLRPRIVLCGRLRYFEREGS